MLLYTFSASISNLVNISAFFILSYQNRWRDRFTAFQCCWMCICKQCSSGVCVYTMSINYGVDQINIQVLFDGFSLYQVKSFSVTDSPFLFLFSRFALVDIVRCQAQRPNVCVYSIFFYFVWINHSILILVYAFYMWKNQKER